MKKYLIFTLLLLGMASLFSCKKSSLLTYDGKQMLYFVAPKDIYNRSIYTVDSVVVSFAFEADEIKEKTLKIPIGLLGEPINTAAPFEVVIDPQGTTAVANTDFELPAKFTFPAKKSSDTISLKVNRAAKMSNNAYIVVLQLKPNAQFNNTLFVPPKTRNQDTKIRIILTDVLKPTPNWANTPDRYGVEHYLGRFTRKKVRVMARVYGFDMESMYGMLDNLTYALFFGQILNEHLKYMKDIGTPVLENDGTLMEPGPYFK